MTEHSSERRQNESAEEILPDMRLSVLGTVLSLVGALLVVVPVLSVLPVCPLSMTKETSRLSGCALGGTSIFTYFRPILASEWFVVGICLGTLGFGLRFSR